MISKTLPRFSARGIGRARAQFIRWLLPCAFLGLSWFQGKMVFQSLSDLYYSPINRFAGLMMVLGMNLGGLLLAMTGVRLGMLRTASRAWLKNGILVIRSRGYRLKIPQSQIDALELFSGLGAVFNVGLIRAKDGRITYVTHVSSDELRQGFQRVGLPVREVYWPLMLYMGACLLAVAAMRAPIATSELQDYGLYVFLGVCLLVSKVMRGKLIEQEKRAMRNVLDSKSKMGLVAALALLMVLPMWGAEYAYSIHSVEDKTFFQARQMIQEGQSEAGISKLESVAAVDQVPGHVIALAEQLTLNENGSLRNYEKSEKLLMGLPSLQGRNLSTVNSVITLRACNAFALGNTEQAIQFAGQLRSQKLVKQFESGKLCGKLKVEPVREVASIPEVGDQQNQLNKPSNP